MNSRILRAAKFMPLLLCLVGSRPALALTQTWSGSSSGNWATAANWSGGVAPAAGDDLVFPAGIARLVTTNNFSPNRAFNSLTLLGSNYFVHGSALILTNGIRVGTPGGSNANPTTNTIVADVQLDATQSFFVTNIFSELEVRGGIALGSRTLTFDGGGNHYLFGLISGVGGAINKAGFGIVNFENNNSFSGGCLIFGGRIRAKQPLSLGTTAGGTIVHSGAMLELQANITNELVTLSGGTLFNNRQPGRWAGPINVVSNSLLLAGGDFSIEGALTGTAKLTVDAAFSGLRADVTLTGNVNNTFTGTLQLLDGVLVLSKPSPNTALGGPLIVGEGIGTDPTNAIVRYAGANQLGSSDVTVQSDGTLDLNGNSDLIGTLTMIGGVVTNTGSGFLQLGGNVSATSVGSVPARIRGQLNLGSVNRTFNVTNGPSASDLQIDQRVFGTGGVIKSGPGTLSLLVSNSFSGVTTVNDGLLEAGNDFALGTTSAATQVNPGATLSLLSAANTVGDSLTLNGDGFGGTNGALRSVGSVTCSGSVVLAGGTLINVAGGTLNLSGAISGAFGLVKIGAGTLRFTGSDNNTYAGDTEVRSGVLELGKTSAFAISNSASLLIGNATDNENADIVRYAAGNQLRTTISVIINRTGVLDLNGFVDDVGSISLTGGTVQTGAGQLQLRGNLTAIGDTTPGSPFPTFDPCLITGNLDLGVSTRTFTVNNHGFLGGFLTDLVVNAVISGSGGITKTGLGELQLGGNNTFSGAITVSAGRLIVAHDNALGATTGGTTVAGSADLVMAGPICVPAEPLTLNSTAPVVLLSTAGTNFWDGPVTLSQTSSVNVAAGSRLDLSGVISGPGGLTKLGPGTLGFEAKNVVASERNNTFAGTLLGREGLLLLGRTFVIPEVAVLSSLVAPGLLVVGDDAAAPGTVNARVTGQRAIHTNSPVVVNSSGALDLSVFDVSIGSLEGAGSVALGASPSAQFTVGNNSLTTAYAGLMSGSRSNVVKAGTGTLTFTANNSYTAPTFVNAGTLAVNGQQGGSDVTVRSNATLIGVGRVGALNAAASSHVAPGASPGRLTSASTVLSNGATLHIELNGPAVATGYDQLDVNGTLNLTGSILDVSLNFPPQEGQVFTIVDNDGSDATTGTFAGVLNATFITRSNIPMQILYNGGTGNDVTLTVTNLALRAGPAFVATGNGNGRVDPNECDTLFLVLSNRSAGTLAAFSATMATTTPGVVITEGFSAYASAGPGQLRTNSAPFQFYTTPEFGCGREIEFLLTVATAAHGTFVVRYVVPSGVSAAPVTFNNNTPLGLPGSGTVSSPLAVSGFTGNLADITVSMVLAHPNLSELLVNLIPPGGPVLPLFGGIGGSQLGTNCTTGRTLFDDDAAVAINSGSAPYVGTFRPAANLRSALGGRASAIVNGVWQLQVIDLVANAQPGALNCWSLNLTPATCTDGGGPCTPCNGPFFGSITTNDPGQLVPIPATAPTTCASAPCGVLVFPDRFPTDTYLFTNGPADACVTVTLDAPCASPTNILLSTATGPGALSGCGDLIGQSARITNSPAAYSFRVPSNGVFTVRVHGGSPGFGLCSNYTLRVDGFDCAVPLTIEKLSPGVVGLCWPTHGADLQLECTTNLVPPFWTAVANPPFVVNGSLCVTNIATNNLQFYRLRKP